MFRYDYYALLRQTIVSVICRRTNRTVINILHKQMAITLTADPGFKPQFNKIQCMSSEV